MPIKLLRKKNYLTMIRNAVKGRNFMFRNLYAEVDGVEKDILEDGRWACGQFISTILFVNKFIKDVHSTVDGTLRDMKENGWYEISEPKEGAVIVWERKEGDDDGIMHSHMGFFVGNEQAISNDSKGSGFPHQHHYTYNGERKIEKIFWHSGLD